MYLLTFALSVFFIYESELYRKKSLNRVGNNGGSVAENKNNSLFSIFFLVLGILIPSILAGVRDFTIGTDVLLYGNAWFEYAVNSTSIVEYVDFAIRSNLGAGYAVLNFLISRITSDPHMYYFIFELIQLIILYKALEHLRDKISIPFAFLVYYLLYYNQSLNILRQIIAILLVLYSYKFIKNKKFIPFALVVLVAFTFHSSAMIGLVLYPLDIAMRSKLRKVYNIIIVVACLGAVAVYQQLFNVLASIGLISGERYGHYFESQLVGGRMVRAAFWAIIILLVMWQRKRCINYMEGSRTLILYSTISFLATLLLFVASAWVIRVVYYFDVFLVILLPILAENLPITYNGKNKGRSRTPHVCLAVFLLAYWILDVVVRNNSATYPFVFFFSS